MHATPKKTTNAMMLSCPDVGAKPTIHTPGPFSHASFDCAKPHNADKQDPICRGSGTRHREQMEFLHRLPLHNQFPSYLSAVYGQGALARIAGGQNSYHNPAAAAAPHPYHRLAAFATEMTFFWEVAAA